MTGGGQYKPHIPSVDQVALIGAVADFFGLPLVKVKSHYKTYLKVHRRKRYAQLGERKTLCFEEAFIIYVIVKLFRPGPTIVEIGTQFGLSTRRIIDITNLAGLDSRVICFDIEDQVKHFSPGEAQLILKDVTHTFGQDVLGIHAPGLIYLDAHPYCLLKNVISEVLNYSGDLILAVHDCSLGLYNPNMKLRKDAPNITSHTGMWERHVLAEVFRVADAASDALDVAETPTHRLNIFDTPHGLGVIVPKQMLCNR